MKHNISEQTEIRGCTGCSICSAVCPVLAITISENEDGFYRPQIDNTKCVSCGNCIKVCYKYDNVFHTVQNEEYECYSAINKCDSELKSGSSGAVSIELMRECLKRGYYVVGVLYDTKSNRAITKIAKEEFELEAFRGSKYFQSYTADAFTEVLSDKSDQKYAIFGTPCQIYAFSKVSELKGNRDKYILVDFFCHGTPSLKLWEKYIEYIKKMNHVDSFDDIKFRSKVYGWHEYAFEFVKGNKSFYSKKINDPFYEIFFGMDSMNEACYSCISRSSVEKTDLRMGDFWGWQFDNNTKGVSAVVTVTSRGAELFRSVEDRFSIKQADFGDIIAAQSYGKIHIYNKIKRKKMLQLLKSDFDIKKIQKKQLKNIPFTSKMKRIVKNTVKLLPKGLYCYIKAVIHKKWNSC